MIVIKIFANEEFLKGDRPIITPIPIEIRVFVSIKTSKFIKYYHNKEKLISCQYLHENILLSSTYRTIHLEYILKGY